MQQAKVSIIIPVYNVPKDALKRSIEAAINQTMKQIEIIVVDDGSTDLSGEICDYYANVDERVKVIHKENGGLASARNSGYRNATGEWITFVDGDDWIEPNTCEDVYRLGTLNDVDVVLFGMIQELKTHYKEYKYHHDNNTCFNEEECRNLQTEILDFTGNVATVPAKLFKKSVLDEHGIEHNENLRQGSEGTEFNIRYFEIVKSAFFTDKPYYHYVYNPESISAKHNEQKHYQVIRCFETIKTDIERSNNIELEKMFYTRFAYVVVATAITGYFSPSNEQIYSAKKKSFLKYLKEPLVRDTIKKADRKRIDKERNIVLLFIRIHWFFPLLILGKIRFHQKNG